MVERTGPGFALRRGDSAQWLCIRPLSGCGSFYATLGSSITRALGSQRPQQRRRSAAALAAHWLTAAPANCGCDWRQRKSSRLRGLRPPWQRRSCSGAPGTHLGEGRNVRFMSFLSGQRLADGRVWRSSPAGH
ncbi:hypothetical protein LNP74_20985 [Klebsiella pneumoniae subsp. pneumoniae]|nr:hypothetical protein [Klebsiella pneumoniae subsp. pneumoniae]